MNTPSILDLAGECPPTPDSPPMRLRTLVDEWLERQAQTTPVERFAGMHDAGEVPVQARYYRDLIPAHAPGKGEQYGFDVDLDACSGCKACVVACHNLNGLRADETWRDVGILVGGSNGNAVQQHVTTACHHCVEPACLDGCPVDAYEKDEVTGVVRHLDDQCIGCQYCTLKCPYDVPKYDRDLGIVRKCDMCVDRLTEGEAPACVQACPNEAIRITIVSRDELRERAREGRFLAGAPDPEITTPTTTYRRKKPLPDDVRPGDWGRIRSENAHTPLVVMLVLTQLSVGAFLVGRLLEWFGDGVFAPVRPVHSFLALGVGLLALAASTLHLGRPLHAWRAIIGLRTSWLSREIVAFGTFANLAVAQATATWLAPQWVGGWPLTLLDAAVVTAGFAGVFCSVMLYHDTKRPFWTFRRTAFRFSMTLVVTGIAATLLAGLVAAGLSSDTSIKSFLAGGGSTLAGTLAGVSAAKLILEAMIFRHLLRREWTPIRRTAALLTGELSDLTILRFAFGVFGSVLVPSLLLAAGVDRFGPILLSGAIGAVFLFTLAGELLERALYFRAVVAWRMPGGL